MESMIQKAINFATFKHEGQVRKFSGLPYVTHPIDVSRLVHDYCEHAPNYEDLIVAAVLHDTLEDTDTSEEEIASLFGSRVASHVKELTSDSEAISQHGKTEYMKKKFVNLNDDNLILKLCDRLSNMLDHPSPKMKVDTIEIITYMMSERILNFTQKLLADKILEVCND